MFSRGLGGWRWRNSWNDLARFQEEMSRLISSAKGGLDSREFPLFNAWVNEEECKLAAELPGIAQDSLDISVQNDTVTVRGERKAEELKEGEIYHRRERRSGTFARTFALPFRVDSAKVVAKYDRGMLTVRLPRAEDDKPRKIQITAA